MALTEKARKFYREYAKDFVGKDAAIRAGYSPRSAKVTASRLLQDQEGQVFLRDIMAAVVERTEIDLDRVLEEIAALAFLDPADLFDESERLLPIRSMPEKARRAIAGLDVARVVVKDSDGDEVEEVRKVKLSDKGANLDRLMRYLGAYKDKLELAGELAIKNLSDEQLDERIALLAEEAGISRPS